MFRTIVVPIDLAEVDISRPAVASAVAMAKQSGGRVILVNVVPIMPVMMLDTVPVSYEAEVAEKAQASLAEVAATLDLPRDRVSAVVKIGGVYHEVLDVATQEGADLVLVGSHRPAMATYLLGSNATAIVRHAKCSVLVLRNDGQPEPRRPAE
jgi:nucleotide-binding universal stress UspA family protein